MTFSKNRQGEHKHKFLSSIFSYTEDYIISLTFMPFLKLFYHPLLKTYLKLLYMPFTARWFVAIEASCMTMHGIYTHVQVSLLCCKDHLYLAFIFGFVILHFLKRKVKSFIFSSVSHSLLKSAQMMSQISRGSFLQPCQFSAQNEK